MRTHRARGASAGYLPRVSFHRYPFHGIIFTLSRYSEKRMAAPSFPLFSHPTTHMALCDSHSLAPITGILSQWVPTPFDFIDNLFRRVFRPLRRLGRRFAVPALVTRSTSRSDSYSLATFRFEVMSADIKYRATLTAMLERDRVCVHMAPSFRVRRRNCRLTPK